MSSRRFRIARLILAGLPETIAFLSKQYGVPEATLQEWSQHLQSVAKPELLLQWALENQKQGVARLPEDFPRLVKAAQYFWAKQGDQGFRQHMAQLHPDKPLKNILGFTLRDIEGAESQLLPKAERLNREREQRVTGDLKPGTKLIANENGYQILEVTDPESACQYGSGTQWCTSSRGHSSDEEAYLQEHDPNFVIDPKRPYMAGNYLKQGPLYIVLQKGKKILQGHPESGQFMDLHDAPLDFSKFPGLSELLEEKVIRPSLSRSFTGVGHWATKVRNQPWPEMEPHLMGDQKYVMPYMRKFKSQGWPEAEPHIAQDPQHALEYTRKVKKSRWPEAEPAIMSSPTPAAQYAHHYMGGQWPEAEQHLAGKPGALGAYQRELAHQKKKANEFFKIREGLELKRQNQAQRGQS